MKKIGVFGGTFNPVHFGHIHLALSLKEIWGIDELLFSPNYESPFPVKGDGLATPSQRFEMLSLALEDVPGCSAIDYEIKRQGPSYTIDLVRYVQSFFCGPDDSLFLLLGEDLLEGFDRWKDNNEIMRLAKPLIGSRNYFKSDSFLSCKIQQILDEGKTGIPIVEISSSNVRFRLKKELYCGHLVSQKVLDYIHVNKLYL